MRMPLTGPGPDSPDIVQSLDVKMACVKFLFRWPEYCMFVQVAAQVGHAAVGLYQALQEKNSWREMAWKWDNRG